MSQAILKALLRLTLRVFFKAFAARAPVGLQRRWINLLGAAGGVPPPGTSVGQIRAGGVPVSVIHRDTSAAASSDRPAILYAHGGGFVLGGPRTHTNLCKHLAASSGADVHLVDYRLAPEHPHPAAVDDLFAAYKAMLERGHDPAQIAFGGDSAGAALAISTVLAIREMDLPVPAALLLISPFVDLGLSGASVIANASRDPVLTDKWLAQGARAYAGGRRLTDPLISPLYAHLHGLPPTLIQVGEDEILLDDSVRLADRAWSAGVDVQLQRYPGLWHDFQAHAGLLDEADGAIGDIAGFLRRCWAPAA